MASGYWVRRQHVIIRPAELPGILSIPDHPRGLVIFVDGSTSSRHRQRSLHIAAELHSRHFATLVFELLTETEVRSRAKLSDIPLLTSRVVDAIGWALSNQHMRKLPIGLFGAGTGAGAALAAAAERPNDVCAVVSRGGRPDLNGRDLGHVRAPTLLIIGGADHAVLKQNDSAFHKLTCLKQRQIIPGAKGFLDEKNSLAAVVTAAAHWLDLYLIPRSAVAASAAGKR